ncbi:VanZ family protein [Patescibacteria group bacterium]|nr:VanZ family protein [Patescibacteria group bacterium]
MKFLRWLPALIWMAVIFHFSSVQTTGVTGTHAIRFLSIYWQRFIILKFFHLAEYGILFTLLFIATNSSKKSFLFGYLYALSDEFHQRFTPGRTSKFSDTLIDLLGLTLGCLFYLRFLKPHILIYYRSILTSRQKN